MAAEVQLHERQAPGDPGPARGRAGLLEGPVELPPGVEVLAEGERGELLALLRREPPGLEAGPARARGGPGPRRWAERELRPVDEEHAQALEPLRLLPPALQAAGLEVPRDLRLQQLLLDPRGAAEEHRLQRPDLGHQDARSDDPRDAARAADGPLEHPHLPEEALHRATDPEAAPGFLDEVLGYLHGHVDAVRPLQAHHGD
mmetsp:Transcript_45968/g.142064  ORF Transcript_45968/g.142064 Transcript_45968/m.142064 type:complete len:202 (+) Transcript_45968:346-951(+)